MEIMSKKSKLFGPHSKSGNSKSVLKLQVPNEVYEEGMDTEVRGGNEKFQLGPLYDSKNPPIAAKTQ